MSATERWAPTQPGETRGLRAGGVDGNARLTGAAGALIFVLLAIEGVTILSIHSLLSVHVFVAMLLVEKWSRVVDWVGC